MTGWKASASSFRFLMPLVLVVVMASTGCSDREPTYEETIAFIANSAGWGDTIHGQLKAASSDPCELGMEIWFADGGKLEYAANMADLAPSTCEVEVPEDIPVVRCSCREARNCARNVTQGVDDKYFGFPTSGMDRGKRAVKAMRRLIEICGGKDDVF